MTQGSPEIGLIVRQLRRRQELTLETLSRISGVSKSILSQIERGDANPTLATVWALARALKIDLTELIGGEPRQTPQPIEIASASFTPEIRTEDGRCVLRILSPADHAETLEWYDVQMAPGGALVSEAHLRGMREHLTVLEGTLEVTSGESRAEVPTGATSRYAADVAHTIRNLSDRPARALLVVTR
ncbi:helix-turn-helix domain-containing protein [Sphingomonas sp.]|uniref:helix-turn-helix domain-containing protein n=1 Tax=Sphingomonas sp. TaxID=28214 RepID=UPI0025D5E3BB|nr:XRE family transcriptional regulator [Sphingomonas sp.]